MRILSITSLFPNPKQPNNGIFVLNRIKGMKKCAEIEVIAPVAYFPFVKKNRPRNIPFFEEMDGIKVYHPKYFSIPKFFKFLDGFFFYLSLKKFNKKLKRADIIDSHFGWPDSYGSYLFAKKYDKKISITLRGRDVTFWQKKFPIRFQKMLSYASVIISVSKSLKKQTKTTLPIKVISNGVDSETFYPINDARKKLGYDKNKKIFLTVGNDFRRKGYFELVNAFKKLDIKDKLLLIVGDNWEKDRLKRLIDNNKQIILVGKVKNDELINYYNACDAFCLVSYSEGCPNSVLEALACGKPCLVTKEAAGEFINEDIGLITNYENLVINLKKMIEKEWNSKKILSHVKNKNWDLAGEKVCEEFDQVLQ